MSLNRYLARVIWLSVAPLLLLLAALGWVQVREGDEDLRRDGEHRAALLSALVKQELHARIGGLRGLALSPSAGDPMHWRAWYREAGRFVEDHPGAVIVVDRNRRLVLHTGMPFGASLPPVVDYAQPSAIEAAFATGRPTIGDAFVDTLASARGVRVAVPVERDGQLELVVASHIPASRLGALLSAVPLPEGWRVVLYDSRREALVDTGGVGPVAKDIDRSAQRFTAVPEPAPWSVEVIVPKGMVAPPLLHTGIAVGGAVLLMTVVALVAGGLASRRLLRAMRAMTGPPHSAATADMIDEVGQVRRQLDEAEARRAAADAERRDSERRYLQQLEQTADSLRLREELLQGIFDSASDAILTADAAHLIVMANQAAARAFGRAVAELVGTPLAQLMPERFRDEHEHHIDVFARSDTTARSMGRMNAVVGLRADGSEFPIEAAISYAHVDGKQLFTVILRDVTERRATQEALRRSQAELQSSKSDLELLIGQLHEAEEAERRRVALELHDELQQVLAAIQMDVSLLDGKMRAAPPELPELVARIDELTRSAIVSTRRIINDLRPLALEELGLVAALESLGKRFAQRHGVAVEVDAQDMDVADDLVDPAVATCLYRVAQEALNNVAKHARARGVELSLCTMRPGMLSLGVHDDGVGFDIEGPRSAEAVGLRGMRERVRALGGTMRVISRPGQGTSLQADIPLHRPTPAPRPRTDAEAAAARAQ